MAIKIVETKIYENQAKEIFSPIEQQAVRAFLNDDPYAGDEVIVGEQNLFYLRWNINITIIYSLRLTQDDLEIYLMTIGGGVPPTQPTTEALGTSNQGNQSWFPRTLEKIGIGVSIKVLYEFARKWLNGEL